MNKHDINSKTPFRQSKNKNTTESESNDQSTSIFTEMNVSDNLYSSKRMRELNKIDDKTDLKHILYIIKIVMTQFNWNNSTGFHVHKQDSFYKIRFSPIRNRITNQMIEEIKDVNYKKFCLCIIRDVYIESGEIIVEINKIQFKHFFRELDQNKIEHFLLKKKENAKHYRKVDREHNSNLISYMGIQNSKSNESTTIGLNHNINQRKRTNEHISTSLDLHNKNNNGFNHSTTIENQTKKRRLKIENENNSVSMPSQIQPAASYLSGTGNEITQNIQANIKTSTVQPSVLNLNQKPSLQVSQCNNKSINDNDYKNNNSIKNFFEKPQNHDDDDNSSHSLQHNTSKVKKKKDSHDTASNSSDDSDEHSDESGDLGTFIQRMFMLRK